MHNFSDDIDKSASEEVAGSTDLAGSADSVNSGPEPQAAGVSEAGEVQPGQNGTQPEPDSLAPASDADIPWRGMPSLPAAEAPAVGILNGMQGAGSEGDVLTACPCRGQDFESEEDSAESELVLGVKISQYGPVYFFRAGQEKVRVGGQVLVETEQGLALGEVVTARRLRLPLPKIRTDEGSEAQIKPIHGLAGPEDIAAASDNRILAASARLFCKECIRERELDMKLVDVEVLHDRSKIIFYFTAPARIDFRELVKDLVRNYHTRIELRQIGVRHETQMIGAVGNCGMTCCCRRYLRKFAPVTIKMAKEQNLFLNPAKLSGICGRLLCCLAYEQENYEEFHKRSPKIGKKYKTSRGFMRVLRANLFRQSIFVMDESNEETEMQLDEWEALMPVRHDQGQESYGTAGSPGQSGQSGPSGRRERRPDSRRDDGPEGERRGPEDDRPGSQERGRRDRDRPERAPREDWRPHDPDRERQRHRNDGISIASQRPFQDMTNDIEAGRTDVAPRQAGETENGTDSTSLHERPEAPGTPIPETSMPDTPVPNTPIPNTLIQDGPVQASRIFGGSGNASVSEAKEDEALPGDNRPSANSGAQAPGGSDVAEKGADKSIFGLPGFRYAGQNERRGNRNKKNRPKR